MDSGGAAADPPADRKPETAYGPRPARKRVCLNGKLVYGDGIFVPDGGYTLDCAIHDISEGGAKIVLARHQALPPEVFLIVVKYCAAHRARVVWQDFPARGLCFSKSYLLNGVLPAELNFLRRLWSALDARSGMPAE